MTDKPSSPLAGLSLERAIHLRWVLRDIKARRTKLSPVSPDDLGTLIEMGLVEMKNDIPELTSEGHRALGGTEGEGGKMMMRGLLILVAISFSAAAFAQSAPPKVGNKALVQVKPKEPTGCKLVGTVKGTKLWAGDCVGGSEIRGTTSATDTQSLPERATGVIPPGRKSETTRDGQDTRAIGAAGLKLIIVPIDST